MHLIEKEVLLSETICIDTYIIIKLSSRIEWLCLILFHYPHGSSLPLPSCLILFHYPHGSFSSTTLMAHPLPLPSWLILFHYPHGSSSSTTLMSYPLPLPSCLILFHYPHGSSSSTTLMAHPLPLSLGHSGCRAPEAC